MSVTVVILFLAMTLVAGFLYRRKHVSIENYLIAGGKVGLPLFIVTNVATWYGGILGVGEFTYNYGVDNWLAQCLPYYFFAILLALFFVKKIRSTTMLSIPEVIQSRYGRKSGFLAATAIFLLSSPAPYLLMTAQILSHFTGWNMPAGLAVIAALTVSYVMYGGYRADLSTDVLFFVVMFAGFSIALAALYFSYGGMSFLQMHLPPGHLRFFGSISPSYLIVWWVIAVWTFADPGFYQRVQSARTVNVAKYGILLSVVLWFLFDFLTNSIGLYARALSPNLLQPARSFLELADTSFSPHLKGLFTIAMLATILSTLNSILLLSGMTFARDIIPAIKKIQRSGSVNAVRLGIVLSAAVSIFIGLALPSAITIWYTLGSVFIPGVLFLFVTSYSDSIRIDDAGGAVVILLSVCTGSFVWVGREYFQFRGTVFSVEPMFVSLLCAFLVFFVRYLWRKKRRG